MPTSAARAVSVEAVAPAIGVQDELRVALVQTFHWYEYVGAGWALHVPFDTVRVWAGRRVPLMAGTTEFVGASKTRAVEVGILIAVPAMFVAFIATVTYLFACAGVRVKLEAVAPLMAPHPVGTLEAEVIGEVQAYHW